MATLANVLQEMRTQPLDFLRHYNVIIAGAGPGRGSGPAVFDFHDAGVTMPTFKTGLSGALGKKGESEVIWFTWNAVDSGQALTANQFRAYYLAMMQVSDPRNAVRYTLPGNGGPDIMLTSQLSGCSFGFGTDTGSGAQLVSHVQPPRGGGSDARGKATEAVGLSIGFGLEGVLQRDAGSSKAVRSYGQAYATVIGVRTTRWRYYAQTWTNEILKAEALN